VERCSNICRGGAKLVLLLLLIVNAAAVSVYARESFVLEGVYEAALDLPRVCFTFKRDPNGDVLYDHSEGNQYAFLDTGASGVLLSKETADFMNISRHPDAEYVDVGVGGADYFDVSEPLFVMTTGLEDDPYDFDKYSTSGPYRLQVRQDAASLSIGVLDVMGVPVMAGKVAVFNTGILNNQITYFPADVLEPNDSNIPATDINIPLRMEKYIYLSNPDNIPPLPDVGYNPVIDNITVTLNGVSTSGDWLLDTGSIISLISVQQGMKLGLVDSNGDPLISPEFVVDIGGIGSTVQIYGFEIDKLSVPTLEGYDLVFKNARVGVHDIGIYDEDTQQFKILDGVFGSNLLTVSVEISTLSLAATAFDYAVVDFKQGILGLDVNNTYEPDLPDDYTNYSGDIDSDGYVNFADLQGFAVFWLDTDCNQANTYCSGADINTSGTVNFTDFALLADSWLANPPCGSELNPYPAGDLNRDCLLDFEDVAIFVREWLNSCDKLNWQCRQADLDLSGRVNFRDLAEFSGNR